MNFKNNRNKIKFFFSLILLVILTSTFLIGWSIVDGSYDKQNKVILFLKKFIPNTISRKIRDIIFIVPDLKTLNKELSLQVKKYEQEYQGQLFEEKYLESKNVGLEFKNFFLPFPRLDVRAGYESKDNRSRAHYLEIINDKIIVISGTGKIIYFNKKNIFQKKLDQKIISSNLTEIIKKQNNQLAGIRDIFYKKNKIYISVIIFNEQKGYSYNIYSAKVDFNDIKFELFFETDTYFKNWSISTGGRIEDFYEDKILFSYGFSESWGSAQDMSSLFGKIISIDLNSKIYEIVSLGHRNPQGLNYVKNKNLIINSEHGPKGGDEINFNFYDKEKKLNFGWDIASYGTEYNGSDPYKKSHKKYGFVEPFKFFTPSIGISEIIFLNKDQIITNKNTLFVSSLRAGSIYLLELDNELMKIEKETRFNFGNERIRDLKYDYDTNSFFAIFEMTPSIGIIKISN